MTAKHNRRMQVEEKREKDMAYLRKWIEYKICKEIVIAKLVEMKNEQIRLQATTAMAQVFCAMKQTYETYMEIRRVVTLKTQRKWKVIKICLFMRRYLN